MKRCKSCDKLLSIENFGKYMSRGYLCIRTLCIFCRGLREKYKMDYKDYTIFLIKQNNLCGLCQQSLSELQPTQIEIDHDHKTGQIRGILCCSCNKSVGYYENGNKSNAYSRVSTKKIEEYVGRPKECA